MERYVKDMLIEMGTMVPRCSTRRSCRRRTPTWARSRRARPRRRRRASRNIPQKAARNAGALVLDLQKRTGALHAAMHKAEGMHEDLVKCAQFLTGPGAAAMEACRGIADKLEVTIGDEYWPLPRYREMLFPV
jgi:glutamine synthetase